jgi:adenylate kinase family enzyme
MTARVRALAEPPELSQHIEAPAGVDLVLERFRLLARRRAAWLQNLWSGEGEPGGKMAVTHGEVALQMEDHDAPRAERLWQQTWPEGQIWPEGQTWREQLARVEEALRHEQTRLTQINRLFGLGAEEADLLQACLAVAVDPALARVCAYLQDRAERTYVTEDLAARLFGYGRCSVWSAESALFRWQLIHARETGVGEPRALMCDPHIRDWVLGRDTMDESLAAVAQPQTPRDPLPSWPVEAVMQFLQKTLRSEEANRVRVTVVGPPGSGRRSFAATIGARLGMPLLTIDVDAVDEQRWPQVFLHAQRHAYLERCALAWTGDSLGQRPWPRIGPLFPLQFAICEPAQELPPVPDLIEWRVDLPALTAAERTALWRQYFPESRSWPEAEFRSLVQRFRASVGAIKDAARKKPVNAQEAAQCVRRSERARLGDLAQRLPCPFGWGDLVVTPEIEEVLRDVVYEAENRAEFWEQAAAQRMFPQGRGLITLLSGSPGTGKTMSAQVVAAALGYDLFRIDLATVVSKYVGETPKNLRRILSRAADMHAVLLFDEADALFSKRATEIRDAQDKFANTDTAFLLQAIESYPGIALLATNQKGNIDPAFIRRLRYVVEFPKPDAAQRLAIWRKVVAGLAGDDRMNALAADLKGLADSIEATGSQIKFAVLGATFVARREQQVLGLRHLLRGVDRELGKEGRTLGSRDRERMLRHGA